MTAGLDIIRKAFRLGWIEGDWMLPVDSLKSDPPVPVVSIGVDPLCEYSLRNPKRFP